MPTIHGGTTPDNFFKIDSDTDTKPDAEKIHIPQDARCMPGVYYGVGVAIGIGIVPSHSSMRIQTK
jgi:hypothetical protein